MSDDSNPYLYSDPKTPYSSPCSSCSYRPIPGWRERIDKIFMYLGILTYMNCILVFLGLTWIFVAAYFVILAVGTVSIWPWLLYKLRKRH